MTNTTTRFFEGLKARGHEPRLEKVKASLRFDLTNGKQTNPLACRDRQRRHRGVAQERQG